MMEITLQKVIISFAVPIVVGILSINAIRKLLKGKIKQFSLEYQLFGYVGMNIFIFGLFYAFGQLSYYLTQ